MNPIAISTVFASLSALAPIARKSPGDFMAIAPKPFCFASRRATARITPAGEVSYRDDPQWFTEYYRREGVE